MASIQREILPRLMMLRIVVLLAVSFSLPFAVLFARKASIITFDTSLVKAGVAPDIHDFYELHFLASCAGMWRNGQKSSGKDRRTIHCTSQPAGYVFSLSDEINNDAGRPVVSTIENTKLNTEAPFVLLVIGLAFTGWALTIFSYNTVAVRRAKSLRELPLLPLRIAFITSIAAPILLTISAAKMTAFAADLTRKKTFEAGIPVYKYMDAGFYVLYWITAVLMWLAFACILFAAFMIARADKLYHVKQEGVEMGGKDIPKEVW